MVVGKYKYLSYKSLGSTYLAIPNVIDSIRTHLKNFCLAYFDFFGFCFSFLLKRLQLVTDICVFFVADCGTVLIHRG